MKQHKLQWYGHITRSSGLAKTFLQGTVQGGRRRGRQRQRCEDNICEWTGLGLSNTVRKAEEREEWRRLMVVTSCGAPTVHRIMGQIDRQIFTNVQHQGPSRGQSSTLPKLTTIFALEFVCWLLNCLTSEECASVSQGRCTAVKGDATD